MSRLPPDSDFSWRLQRFVIGLLYKSNPHHPTSYPVLPQVGGSIHAVQGVRYAYRSADGSDYNPLFPSLGRAGTPYAHSVPSATTTSTFRLPEPSLVFDTLLQRDEFIPHPGGLSSLFFAFANLIVHTIFNTNRSDWSINNASSYLDLSVLYGNSEQQVNAVRRNDGTGKLWEDVFADGRLLFMPPSVGALLVMFSRNHNVCITVSKFSCNNSDCPPSILQKKSSK
jgi:prostaglandin-endoperoxide synthase 2